MLWYRLTRLSNANLDASSHEVRFSQRERLLKALDSRKFDIAEAFGTLIYLVLYNAYVRDLTIFEEVLDVGLSNFVCEIPEMCCIRRSRGKWEWLAVRKSWPVCISVSPWRSKAGYTMSALP